MARPKRSVMSAAAESSTPPDELRLGQLIMRVVKPAGNNIYEAISPTGEIRLVEMPTRFRSTIWIKRNSFILVNTSAFTSRTNKLGGEIAAVVLNEREWRKQAYWPSEFTKSPLQPASDDEDSTVGKLPPTDSDSDS